MASDLDTVRVLKALFHDIPRAPEGLGHEETMAWIQRSMQDFPGGDLAYTLEHVTRNSMLDIVLRLREDGHLQDDTAVRNHLAAALPRRGSQAVHGLVHQRAKECGRHLAPAQPRQARLERTRAAVQREPGARAPVCGGRAHRCRPHVRRVFHAGGSVAAGAVRRGRAGRCLRIRLGLCARRAGCCLACVRGRCLAQRHRGQLRPFSGRLAPGDGARARQPRPARRTCPRA